VIYWKVIEDFDSACKCIRYMSWYEYEHILHCSDVLERYGQRGWFLKRACTHYCNLRKLDKVSKKKEGIKYGPKKLSVKIIGKYIEFYNSGKRVCGYPIKGMPAGVMCERLAGQGTKHHGFGYCAAHEGLLLMDEKRDLWIQLKLVHGNVPSLKDLVIRAEKISDISVKTMDGDLTYLEIARQAIMQKVEANGGIPLREHTADLAYISEVMAKVKALKVKTEALNWIPPEQVIGIILQVMDAVTKNENDDVRRRIAERAKDIGSILVPRIDSGNQEIPSHRKQEDVVRALQKAGSYVEQGTDWSEIPEVTGYDKPIMGRATVQKPVPNYKKTHRLLTRDKSKDKPSD